MKFDLNEKLAELIGTIIGDGCIRYKPKMNQYYIEIVGDINKEKAYFNYLKNILNKELNLKAHIKIRERALRLKVYSKDFIEFLLFELKLPSNKEKCQNVFIPERIIKNKKLLNSCLRGIVDTDGSLFLAKKSHRSDYPSIEISTTSEKLAKQLKDTLSPRFRIGFRSHKRKNFFRLYVISLNGEKMVDEWVKEIGFSNIRNLERYQKLKYGTTGI